MELFNQLTEEDLTTLKVWIESNRSCVIPDMQKVLRCWSKNKRTMFKLLGNKLRVKFPISVKADKQFVYRSLQEIYNQPYIYLDTAMLNGNGIIIMDDTDNDFINNVGNFFCSFYEDNGKKRPDYTDPNYGFKLKGGLEALQKIYSEYDFSLMRIFSNIFSHYTLEKGVMGYDYHFYWAEKNKKLSLPKDMKIMKGIQKLLKFLEYPNMHLFEEWRNQISNITTTQNITANLVISIHPLDFLTLSDNSCGWKSCLKFQDGRTGGYSMAITEMLNSNCIVVAYLESNNKKFVFNYREIPNKTYRQLFVCHKDIILSGKSYPYIHDDLTHLILNYLQVMAAENLNWHYQYGPQEYHDMHDGLAHNVNVNRITLDYPKKHHNILICTNGYYNDWAEACCSYYCVRNWVSKSKRICVSGPATCLVCGKRLVDNENIEAWMNHDYICDMYENSICKDCEDHRCLCCRVLDTQTEIYHFIPKRRVWIARNYCKHCLETELLYNIHDDIMIAKTDKYVYPYAELIPAIEYFNRKEENAEDISDLCSV